MEAANVLWQAAHYVGLLRNVALDVGMCLGELGVYVLCRGFVMSPICFALCCRASLLRERLICMFV